MHYFQWDESVAQVCLDLGLLVSIGKPLLRMPELQETIKSIPLDHIVLETDSYPQYFKRNRSRWTEPKDVREIAMKLAELKGLSLDTVAKTTTGNLVNLLKNEGKSKTGRIK